MESVDPYQISLVEALDDNFRKLAIDLVVSRPQCLFAASATVKGSLLKVITTEFRELGSSTSGARASSSINVNIVTTTTDSFFVILGPMRGIYRSDIV